MNPAQRELIKHLARLAVIAYRRKRETDAEQIFKGERWVKQNDVAHTKKEKL